jgi:hypothetical protein
MRQVFASFAQFSADWHSAKVMKLLALCQVVDDSELSEHIVVEECECELKNPLWQGRLDALPIHMGRFVYK